MVKNQTIRNIARGGEIGLVVLLTLRFPFLWPALCLIALSYIPAKAAKK